MQGGDFYFPQRLTAQTNIRLPLNSSLSIQTFKMVVVLVTGGNTGIGEQVAHQLARQPDHHIIIASRNADAGAKVAADITATGHSASSVQLDLASDESINAAVEYIKDVHGKLDVLVNNAGVAVDFNPGLSRREIFNQDYNVNVAGTAVLTDALLPLLRKTVSPRVVFVSSSLASMTLSTDKTWPYYNNGGEAYSCSKAALNRLANHYAKTLAEVGALVNAVCPGLVKTKLNNYREGGTTPEEGASRIVELALLRPGGPTATFSGRNGTIPW
ncbi:short-chain dehydrogenase [Colletotrichum truncatum]|uniref:Short-chain dehydrogenase n=1 Tax=Colletotrichum truncatum TaxID=5467 RepID=A0ACC3ZF74_COLTU|nr:short-chain dehydrogenase [Colletotrichum truncatum]KAF6801661.1 short-chain dehydrogenase [Colletotrichum truncatum]